MASIILDMDAYYDNYGHIEHDGLHALVEGLDVTFDEIVDPEATDEEDSVTRNVEFTGKYERLLELIDRYTPDLGEAVAIIFCITDIHS